MNNISKKSNPVIEAIMKYGYLIQDAGITFPPKE